MYRCYSVVRARARQMRLSSSCLPEQAAQFLPTPSTLSMNTFRLPGAVSLSFRSLESPFHGVPGWNRPLSHLSGGPRLPNSFSRFPRSYAPLLDMTSLQRSLSIGSASSGKTEERAEASDLLTELRPLTAHSETTAVAPPPGWMQELMQSNSTRPSRASSIVSTRTRFSTTTLDDPRADCRSIDIHVGGQYFRISRDGSKITEDLPPPYTGPPPPSLLRLSSPDPLLSRSSSVSMLPGGRSRSSSVWDGQEDDDEEAGESLTAVQESPVMMQANILDPAEVDMPSPVDGSATARGGLSSDVSGSEENPERNPSYRAGPDRIFVPAATRRQRRGSEETTPARLNPYPSTPASPLRRRNGVRLPSLVTDSLDGRMSGLSSRGRRVQARRASTSPLAVRSAGPILMNTSDMAIPDSPTFIGRDASALFPRIPRSRQEAGTSSESRGADLELGDDETSPLAMDSENDISLHYARLMRRLDREHRKALHEKDKELEQLRVRLNEVDTVYRQELRARDFMIDDLKKRLDHLQETQEQRMEEARHEIEDLWESRWKQRDFHLRERMRRLEEVHRNSA